MPLSSETQRGPIRKNRAKRPTIYQIVPWPRFKSDRDLVHLVRRAKRLLNIYCTVNQFTQIKSYATPFTIPEIDNLPAQSHAQVENRQLTHQ